MKKVTILTILLLNFISCKKNEAELTTQKIDSIPSKIEEATLAEPTTESDKLLSELKNNETQFLQKIIGKSQEKVNVFFDSFREKHESIIAKLNTTEEKLLDEYNGFYNEKRNEYVIPENLKSKFDNFKKAHLELNGIGEGYNEIQLDPSYYSTLTQNNITEDYKAFLKSEAKDNAVLYQADAGLGITFEEVSQRALYWENFLVKYPESKLYNRARELYGMYIMDYMFGMDNTPTINFEDNNFYPENKKEFDRFLTKNPASTSAKILKIMLDNFSKYDNTMNLRNFIDTEQKKYFIPKSK